MDTNIPVNDEPVVEDDLQPLHRPDTQPLNRRPNATRRIALGATMVGSLLIGGAAGVGALAGPATVNAQSSTTTTSPTASSSPTSSSEPSTGAWAGHGPGDGLGPNHEAVTDTSVAAKAIGISESDLLAALAKGQTIAQVAKAHNVDPQKVIDALVTDGLDELATAVKNGTLTQAQADAQKAEVTQRATDQVNGTMPVMPH